MALIVHKSPSSLRPLMTELRLGRETQEEMVDALKRIKLALYLLINKDLDKEIV